MNIVLIFESDDAIRLVLKRIIESEGYLVFTADYWKEALEKIRILQKQPERFIVLADISVDGTKLIEALSRQEPLDRIPVIPMSTGKENECFGKKVLKKPVVSDELLNLIKMHFDT